MKVLHVDDSSEDRELIRYRLQKLDSEIEIIWADNASKALEIAREQEFDCILSDYQMPAVDGLSFLKSLRNTGNETPFIFLTGQGNEGVAANAFKAGADDYYTKDLEISHFARIINSMKNLTNVRKYIGITQKFRQQLNETNERFNIFTQTSRDGFLLHNNDKITHANAKVAEMVGTPNFKLVGKNMLDLFPADEQAEIINLLNGRFQGEHQSSLLRADGSSFDVEIQFKEVSSGNNIYKVAVIRDIEDQVELQKALASAENTTGYHTSMLRSLAVQLRKPASIMESFYQMMKQDPEANSNNKHVTIANEVEKISESLFNLSQELSDYIWIANKELALEEIHLSDLFYNCLETIKASDPELIIESNVENGVATLADSQLMEIAFRSLLDNITKFRRKGENIEIGFGSINMDGNQVQYISDNGLGFETKDDNEIFEPFTRLHNKTLFQGHGLGLTKVKLIIERHNGRIWTESTPGHGSTFFFTLSHPKFKN
jgi:PAS domain S-box-containing protein